jgi:hypothetical protein
MYYVGTRYGSHQPTGCPDSKVEEVGAVDSCCSCCMDYEGSRYQSIGIPDNIVEGAGAVKSCCMHYVDTNL